MRADMNMPSCVMLPRRNVPDALTTSLDVIDHLNARMTAQVCIADCHSCYAYMVSSGKLIDAKVAQTSNLNSPQLNRP